MAARVRTALALVAGALALAVPVAAQAAPALRLEAPRAQQPDDGYGTSWEGSCRPACEVRFSARVVRAGKRVRGIATFPVFRRELDAGGSDFWYRWSEVERRRLDRALDHGPLTMVVRGVADDGSGESRRSLRFRLRRPVLEPPAGRVRAFPGKPFLLPTPRGFRYLNPDRVRTLDNEGDNVALVARSAKLPRAPGWLEWDYTRRSGVGSRSDEELRRLAGRVVRRRFAGFGKRRAIGRRRVDEGRAFSYRIPNGRLVYRVTVAFYGDEYHEVDCVYPARRGARAKALRDACDAVLRGARLRY